MNRTVRFLRMAASCVAAVVLLGALDGCQQEAPKPPPPKYASEGKRTVPPFMSGTVYEVTDLQNDQPFLVSGWGLVVNLDGTGGSRQVPNTVKAYMVKQMEKNGFGSKLLPEFQNLAPEAILQDPDAAVVAVYGWIPPGARKGQWFDIALRAEGLEVTSLARGLLYDTELAIDGANAVRPMPPVNVWATAYGPVFVNPAAALNSSKNPDAATKRSLRAGTVIGGGQVMTDRPLLLRLRMPENRLSRAIEMRVNDAFHQDKTCTAYDMGYCQLWVPPKYNGDWEHFSKLVEHVYLQGGSEAFARAKARELAAEARKPGAPLQDISYCWEGLGQYALPELAGLLADAPVPVRFAAARAAAYIGDPSGAAERALFDIASTSHGAFQVPAVQVLGRVQNSRAVNELLRRLLDADQTTVRVEAYTILAAHHDPAVQSRVIASAKNPADQKFVLDFVRSHGAPLIYATRSGLPRIAIFGDVPELQLPLTFSVMENRLMIASRPVGRDVTIFYRGGVPPREIEMASPPDVADVLARLAGQMDDGTGQLDFTYAEVLAILQALSDQQKLRVVRPTGEEVAAAFLLQAPPAVRDAIDNAPLLDRGRPQEQTGPGPDAGPAGRPAVAGQAGDARNAAVSLEKR